MSRGYCRFLQQHRISALSLYCILLLVLFAPLSTLFDETISTSRLIFCSAFSITAAAAAVSARTPTARQQHRHSFRPNFLQSSLDTNGDSLKAQRHGRFVSTLYATLLEDDNSDFIIEPSSKSGSSDGRNLEQQNSAFPGMAVEIPRDPRRRRGGGGGGNGRTDKNVGGYDPTERLGRGVDVGDPQIMVKEKERSVTSILKELAAIQQQGPQKYCILGTRHCSYLHQQIIELLAYALVLSGNHVYTSGAGGTHAATIRGALRAERPDLLTVVLPQSMSKQTKESQELLERVDDVIAMPQNDEMSLDIASRICNSYLLSQTDQLISFAFHESTTVIEATKEAKKLDLLVTVLYLD